MLHQGFGNGSSRAAARLGGGNAIAWHSPMLHTGHHAMALNGGDLLHIIGNANKNFSVVYYLIHQNTPLVCTIPVSAMSIFHSAIGF